MKIRMTLWLAATAILCFAAFWFGRSQLQPVYLYDQNPLRIDLALLTSLHAGDTTNVVEKLDALLELETLAAMRNRSSLQDHDRKILDQTLERVARYRQQHPWLIDTNTNGIPPLNLPGQVTWIEEQKQVEAFFRDLQSRTSSLTPRWSQRRLPLEFMDGLSYTTIIEFAEPLARRRGSALDR